MGCMPDPRLSILVPNFNNGRESSRTGTRDFISDLFQSLVRTLEHDPTPLEIIVADDGSTDDSLATCRRWAQRTWRGGVPFCRLVELEHCGVLSAVANRMTADARGELCCRLDGDVIVLTRNWAAELCRIFDAAAPGLDVVGAKQLGPDGRVHSAGDWVLHPRGYHHVGQGAPRASIGRAIEVDHVMGCFYCHRRSVWKELGGYDETLLRGQTVDLSLRVRLGGGRIICTPTVEFVHYHAERAPRENRADSAEGLADTLRRFRAKSSVPPSSGRPPTGRRPSATASGSGSQRIPCFARPCCGGWSWSSRSRSTWDRGGAWATCTAAVACWLTCWPATVFAAWGSIPTPAW
jgi:glycosyltransferase involved in cell wall biosynthesis